MGAVQFIENMDRTSLTITDDEFEKNVEAAVSAIAEKHRPRSPPEPLEPSEKSVPDTLQPPGESSARRSFESTSPGDPSTPRRSTSSDGPESEDQAAITGLLRTIQKPLTTIGRIFSDETSDSGTGPASTPRTPARSAGLPEVPGEQSVVTAEEAAARQASAEAAEAQRLHRAEHANVVETLAGMFPDLDREVISDVVYQKQGR